MRILESDIGYSKEDIIDQINEELGFSVVMKNDDNGYIILSNNIRLLISFYEDEVSIKLSLPSKELDLSKSLVILELYSDALESASEVVNLIRRMTS